MSRYYAGIGSRETPQHILDVMTGIATTLKSHGWILRSGGADGADQAFENGAQDRAQIILPYDGFRSKWIDGRDNHSNKFYLAPKGHEEIASRFHPAWGKLKRTAKEFHTRNVTQIFGFENEPKSSFVVCWTPTGKATGGTGQAMRIADHYSIPICNLYNESFKMFLSRHPEIVIEGDI